VALTGLTDGSYEQMSLFEDTESKERSPLKESLEELRPSVQEVSNQEEMKEAQKAIQTAHRRRSRQQKLREGILWSAILEKKW
jgi:hypothetical protein